MYFFLHSYILFLHSEKDSYVDSTIYYNETEAAASTCTQTLSLIFYSWVYNSLGLKKNTITNQLNPVQPPEIRSFAKLHIRIPLFILSI